MSVITHEAPNSCPAPALARFFLDPNSLATKLTMRYAPPNAASCATNSAGVTTSVQP